MRAMLEVGEGDRGRCKMRALLEVGEGDRGRCKMRALLQQRLAPERCGIWWQSLPLRRGFWVEVQQETLRLAAPMGTRSGGRGNERLS